MNQGYEYNLVLIAAALALAETGPGSPSVDAALGSEAHGTKWALLALLLGAAGAAGAHFAASSAPAPDPAPLFPTSVGTVTRRRHPIVSRCRSAARAAAPRCRCGRRNRRWLANFATARFG